MNVMPPGEGLRGLSLTAQGCDSATVCQGHPDRGRQHGLRAAWHEANRAISLFSYIALPTFKSIFTFITLSQNTPREKLITTINACLKKLNDNAIIILLINFLLVSPL